MILYGNLRELFLCRAVFVHMALRQQREHARERNASRLLVGGVER